MNYSALVEQDHPDFQSVHSTETSYSTATRPQSNQQRVSGVGPVVIRSRDDHQIQLDVNRCTWHLLTGSQRVQRLQMEYKQNRKVARLIHRKQQRLANLLNMTLLFSPPDDLRYYQGYHDVACIFLSVLGETDRSKRRTDISALGLQAPSNVLHRVSHSHLKDCLRKNFLQLQTTLRLTVFPLLALFDPPIHDYLEAAGMEPFFVLSWVITWYSHEIRDTQLVKRLFDVFLVSHPLFPVYVAIAMITHSYNRREILETECDFAALHATLTGLPKNSSLFGWKYRPGDGTYVSDDEYDDGTVSTGGNTNEGDHENPEFYMIGLRDSPQKGMGHHHFSFSGSTDLNISMTTTSLDGPRVPFQELIDKALTFIDRMPPRKLLALATRYYGKEQVQQLFAPDISYFQSIPSWMIASFPDYAVTVEEGILHVAENSRSKAVIAVGYGKGDEELRRKRRRRRVVIASAIAVALVAVAVGVWIQSQSKKSIKQETPQTDVIATSVHIDTEILASSFSALDSKTVSSGLQISPSILRVDSVESGGEKNGDKSLNDGSRVPSDEPVLLVNKRNPRQRKLKSICRTKKRLAPNIESGSLSSRNPDTDTPIIESIGASGETETPESVTSANQDFDHDASQHGELGGDSIFVPLLSSSISFGPFSKEIQQVDFSLMIVRSKILDTGSFLSHMENHTVTLQSFVDSLNQKFDATSTLSEGRQKLNTAVKSFGWGLRAVQSTALSVPVRLERSELLRRLAIKSAPLKRFMVTKAMQSERCAHFLMKEVVQGVRKITMETRKIVTRLLTQVLEQKSEYIEILHDIPRVMKVYGRNTVEHVKRFADGPPLAVKVNKMVRSAVVKVKKALPQVSDTFGDLEVAWAYLLRKINRDPHNN